MPAMPQLPPGLSGEQVAAALSQMLQSGAYGTVMPGERPAPAPALWMHGRGGSSAEPSREVDSVGWTPLRR